jgi:hypothetical protein
MKPMASAVANSIGDRADGTDPQRVDVDLVRSSLVGLEDCQSDGDFIDL